MNRYRKEEKMKQRSNREGFSEFEIKKLDSQEAQERKISELAHKLHIERFPEEYDYQYDSILDANDRSNGINPMSEEYIQKVKKRRKEAGVPPLAENGMPTSDATYKLCYQEAKKLVSGI